MNILIKNGHVIDPLQGVDGVFDILIKNGKIDQVGKKIREGSKATQIDAGGKIVAPGFVDMHTHLREPGREETETLETGSKAAIYGGFTTINAMPNTNPACDSQAHVKFIFDRACELKLANILPVGTITKAREGKTMSEIGELKDAGCLAISDDGDSVYDAFVMRRALEYAAMLDILVISHCEDKELSAGGVMHEGYWSTVLGMNPIPKEAESIIVDRDIQLAELSGARLHIAHVSTAESVEIIKCAKARGVKVTCEVTPHHFTLSDEDLKTFDTNMKVNPPLRSKRDVEALKKGLRDGTIDAIATDHAPHLANEKEREFGYAPFGMIGLETALSLSVMKLIDGGVLDWAGLISKLSVNPSKILNYNRGSLEKGSIADIVIIDPTTEWVYDKKRIKSRSSNSPFLGQKMKAMVTDVVIEGRVILKEGKLA